MESLKEVGRFLYRHKNKIAIASIVAIGTAIYYSYNKSNRIINNNIDEENLEEEEEGDEYEFFNPRLRQRSLVRNSTSSRHIVQDSGIKAGMRSKYMLRIRKQFDSYAKQFLPTLRIKIKEVVDVSSAVRKIKELRGNSPDSGGQEEIMLWEEIKVHSFTMLFVTSYMISAMVVLLRIQLHVLARQLKQMNLEGNRNGTVLSTPLSSSSSSTSYNDEINGLDNNLGAEMFAQLIEGTYQQLFNTGLVSLAKLVKQRIANLLSEWTIKKKLKVEYEELLEIMTTVRRSLEENITELISMIIIPSESNYNNIHKTGTIQNDAAHQLIAQTWDIVECPLFPPVFSEATEICFRRIFDNLKRNIFSEVSDYSSSSSPLRSPPLASLLPQLKAICSRLLPDDAICQDVKEVYSGPSLDALCVSIFDAVDTKV